MRNEPASSEVIVEGNIILLQRDSASGGGVGECASTVNTALYAGTVCSVSGSVQCTQILL